MTLNEVYALLGLTRQNISYWALHSYSTQSRRSIYDVIGRAADIFMLDDEEAEALANGAGLSLDYDGGDLIETLGYDGKLNRLCAQAMISDRMLRRYRHTAPTKQTLMALAVVLNKSCEETDAVFRRYGYCLSDSIIGDVVVRWYLDTYHNKIDGELLIFSINDTLEKMGVPLLMTKQS